MEKSSINPVFVITMAILPLISITAGLNEVVFLGLCVGLIYILASLFTSIVEKITDRNLTFFVYMVISATIASILAFVFSKFPNSIFTSAGDKVYFAAVSAGVLGLNQIYQSSNKRLAHYYFKMVIQVPSFIVMLTVFGIIREVFGYGTFWGNETGIVAVEFFTTTGGAYLILAFLCAFANAYWLKVDRKNQQYNMLVSKYKIRLNRERNLERVNLVNQSELNNFGVSELIPVEDDVENSGIRNDKTSEGGSENE